MTHGTKWTQRLTSAADLEDECIPGLPLIEIVGDKRVLIEHHCGVTEYGKQRIVVQVNRNCVCVSGEELVLTKMTPQQLIISGTIHSVELTGR